MKIVYFIIALISPLFLSSNSIGGATPYIQAVCKITMQNNQIIEGFFDIGGGGIEMYYKPDAIYLFFKENNSHQLKAFDLTFKDFSPANLRAYREGKIDILYAKNISKGSPKLSHDFTKSEEGKILIKNISAKHEYQLKDSIIIYNYLPEDLLLSGVKESDKSKIAVNMKDIKKIQFYQNPPKKWLVKIEEAKKKDSIHNENWEYTYIEWYHDILKDKERTDFLMKYFKFE